MTGEELYAVWCHALFVDWPQPPRKPYLTVFDAAAALRPPCAWPFLSDVDKAGWNNLAEALTERFGVSDGQ